MRNIRKLNRVKMKKKLLILVFALFGTTETALTQNITDREIQQPRKWTIELSSGFRSEIFESPEHRYEVAELKTGRRLSFPQIEVSFWYAFKDYFALESGLAYVQYNTNWGCGYKMFIPKHKLYSALQIPLRIRFSVPLKGSNFSFFSTTGVILQFPIQAKAPHIWIWDSPYEYFDGVIDNSSGFGKVHYHLRTFSPMCGINILLNTKIGFMYKFDFGLGISVFGEYYKGTRTMAMIDGVYKETYHAIPSESETSYETKGDYWNAGIGISYSFKNTNKKGGKNR